MFAGKNNNALAIEIKEYIDCALLESRSSRATAPTPSLPDELQKLVDLRAQGILSDEEFKAAKKKLIG